MPECNARRVFWFSSIDTCVPRCEAAQGNRRRATAGWRRGAAICSAAASVAGALQRATRQLRRRAQYTKPRICRARRERQPQASANATAQECKPAAGSSQTEHALVGASAKQPSSGKHDRIALREACALQRSGGRVPAGRQPCHDCGAVAAAWRGRSSVPAGGERGSARRHAVRARLLVGLRTLPPVFFRRASSWSMMPPLVVSTITPNCGRGASARRRRVGRRKPNTPSAERALLRPGGRTRRDGSTRPTHASISLWPTS